MHAGNSMEGWSKGAELRSTETEQKRHKHAPHMHIALSTYGQRYHWLNMIHNFTNI